MSPDKTLSIALIISMSVHGLIVCVNLPLFKASSRLQMQRSIQVAYVKLSTPANTLTQQDLRGRLQQRAVIAAVQMPVSQTHSTSTDMHGIMPRSMEIAKPSFDKGNVDILKKKIYLPSLPSDKMNPPSYNSYLQIVREKIRRVADQECSRIREDGEIHLSFVVHSDGALSQVRWIPEKTAASQNLRDAALKCVSDAAPFPAFPQELAHNSELTFTVSIQVIPDEE